MEIRGEGDGEGGGGYTTKIKLKCALVCCHGDSRQEEKRHVTDFACFNPLLKHIVYICFKIKRSSRPLEE